MTETGDWKDVLIYDSTSAGEETADAGAAGRVVASAREQAAAGRRRAGRAARAQPWIVLEDAVTHQFQRARPATYRVNNNRELRCSGRRFRVEGWSGMTSRCASGDTMELIDIARSGEVAGDAGKSAERRTQELRTAQVELHRRFAVPAASIVFALLALPLGIGSRSGGRGRGFVISVAVVLVYYVSATTARFSRWRGRLPVWLGMWLPNIDPDGTRAGSDGPNGSVAGRTAIAGGPDPSDQAQLAANGGWRGRPGTRRQVTRDRPIRRRSAFRRRFGGSGVRPGFLRCSTGTWWLACSLPCCWCCVSTAALYIVIDLTEHVSTMADHDAPLTVILAYYWNLMPQVMVDVIPFGMLIAVLIVLTMLERQHELTALKGGGVSLFRLMVPVLLVASVGGVAMWLLAEHAVPQANREKDRLLDVIEGKEAAALVPGHRPAVAAVARR